LLSYLIKSSVRRRLLRLLWREKCSGSISSLARQADLSFSATHKELAEMKLAGLATSRHEGKDTVYRPNLQNPNADLLKKLLSAETSTSDYIAGKQDFDEAEVLDNLVRLGLPIAAGVRSPVTTMAAETALARALVLSHHDPTLAKALPVLIDKLADRLDKGELVRTAKELGQKHTLGFFLQLTEALSGRSELRASLKDGRQRRSLHFFPASTGRYSRELAKKNTPEIARDWLFIMNMPMSSFQSFFKKHSSNDE